MRKHFDIIVIGLGAMGSAAVYQLARRGAHVLGLDRYEPPHTFGSSHAETRITRLAVGEGASYIPLVARSHEIWRELEASSGRALLFETGGYIVEAGSSEVTGHWGNFVGRTAEVARQAGVPYELLTPAEVRARQPVLLIEDQDQVGFEPTGGVVLSEAAITTQLTLARQLGAAIQINEMVTEVKWTAAEVTVKTTKGRYTAGQAIVAAGAWIRDFVPLAQQNHFRITRQVAYWFAPENPAAFSTNCFPFFLYIGRTPAEYFGAFPMPPHGIAGVKVLTEQYAEATDPATVQREISAEEINYFYHTFVARRLTGLTSRCVQAAACLYTHTPDADFVIDHHPDSRRILIASPCSGHGFKHSAAVGECLAQLLLEGKSKIDIQPFAFARLQ